MRILFRYVLREFLLPLGYCLGGFVAIYVLFELFGSFARLADSHLPFGVIVSYFCGYLAPHFEWLAPAALMLATLYTMWGFCRHSELVAMRASGVGFFAIVKPLLLVAVLMAGFVSWVNECYVPRRAEWAKVLRAAKFNFTGGDFGSNLVYRNAASNRTWTVNRVADPAGEHFKGVKVSIDRPGGARLMTVTADAADRLDGQWWFVNPKVQHFDPNGAEMATPVPELDALKLRLFPEFDERPSDILAQNRALEYDSVVSRLQYLRRHPNLPEDDRRKGFYNAWAQLVSPLSCIVITLFAIPAGVVSGRQSVFKGVLGALAMFFAFYALTIGCMVAANEGGLPPLLAAVLPNLLFFSFGLFLFRRQR